MAQLTYDEEHCVRFLNKFKDWPDPTWGFWVYGTYSRPQGQSNADGDADGDTNAQEAADTARFEAILARLRAHAADTLWYRHPAPYNQQLIDTLSLQPAAYLPGASLGEVCTHFLDHHACILGENPKEEDYVLDAGMGSPKYGWCLVIDDEALQSIKAVPEPVGVTLPEGVCRLSVMFQARKAFVKLLSAYYHSDMEESRVLYAEIPGGGNPIVWIGWLKFSPVILMDVFTETLDGDIDTYYEGPDTLLRFPGHF